MQYLLTKEEYEKLGDRTGYIHQDKIIGPIDEFIDKLFQLGKATPKMYPGIVEYKEDFDITINHSNFAKIYKELKDKLNELVK